MFKKIVSFFVATLIWGSSTLSVCANTTNNNEVPRCVVDLSNEYDMGDVAIVRNLYGNDNNVIAYCAEMDNGYFIYDLNGVIVEYCPTGNSPFADVNYETDVYYACPFGYYVKESNDRYINVLSDEVMTDEQFDEQLESTCSVSLENKSGIEAYSSNELKAYDTLLPGSTRLLNYNTMGTCGSMAATIMLCYLYDNVDTAYLYSYLASNTKTLHDYLVDYIELEDEDGTRHGSTAESFLGGMRVAWSHLSNKTVHMNCYKDTSNMWGLAYYEIISAKMPLCMQIDKHPIYGFHWVMVHGTSQLRDGNTVMKEYYIVNDGWGREGVRILDTYNFSLFYLS